MKIIYMAHTFDAMVNSGVPQPEVIKLIKSLEGKSFFKDEEEIYYFVKNEK